MVRTFSNNELARSLVLSFQKKKICGIDSNNPDADHGLNFRDFLFLAFFKSIFTKLAPKFFLQK